METNGCQHNESARTLEALWFRPSSALNGRVPSPDVKPAWKSAEAVHALTHQIRAAINQA